MVYRLQVTYWTIHNAAGSTFARTDGSRAGSGYVFWFTGCQETRLLDNVGGTSVCTTVAA